MESEKVKELKKFIEISAGLGCYYKLANCEITMLEVIEYINELESENERLKTSEFNFYQELDNASTQIHSLEERIAELESENAKLANAVSDNLEAYRDGFSEGASFKDRVNNELKDENQQLKDRIAGLEKEIKENPSYAKGYADGIKNTYEEVLPQFVERLKEKFKEKVEADNVDAFVECSALMRDLLKEFLGNQGVLENDVSRSC